MMIGIGVVVGSVIAIVIISIALVMLIQHYRKKANDDTSTVKGGCADLNSSSFDVHLIDDDCTSPTVIVEGAYLSEDMLHSTACDAVVTTEEEELGVDSDGYVHATFEMVSGPDRLESDILSTTSAVSKAKIFVDKIKQDSRKPSYCEADLSKVPILVNEGQAPLGLMFNKSKYGVVVKKIVPGHAVWLSGHLKMQVGNEIIEIQGKPIKHLTVSEIQQLLKNSAEAASIAKTPLILTVRQKDNTQEKNNF